MIFTVEENFQPRRLDVYLSERLADKSRSHIQKLIDGASVTLDPDSALCRS